MVEFNDNLLELPRCGDKWLMREFLRFVFSVDAPIWPNIVCIHMQVLILSYILNASGKILNENYLLRRKTDDKWSKLNFPKEQPPNKECTLWKAAIRQVVPIVGNIYLLENLTQDEHKIWN